MSDLRTELFTKVIPKMKTLTELNFDDPDQPMEPAVLTNNEMIFNWVKEHPASYSTNVVNGFRGRITESSVVSQLYTMTNRKLLHKVKCSTTGKFMYSAAVDAYPRVVRTEAIAKMQAARAAIGKEEMARRIAEGHKVNRAAEAETKLEPVQKKVVLIKRRTPEPVAAVSVTPVDLNTLSIVQARKLYDELKQIFGA